jgi:hypothetical protein
MKYFHRAEKKWRQVYDNKKDMRVLYMEMDYNYGSRHKDWRWIKENIPNSYGIMV